MLGRGDDAQVVGTGPRGEGAADGGGDMVVAGRYVRHEGPEDVEGRPSAELLREDDVRLDLVQRYVARTLVHDLDAVVARLLRELAEEDELLYLGGVGRGGVERHRSDGNAGLGDKFPAEGLRVRARREIMRASAPSRTAIVAFPISSSKSLARSVMPTFTLTLTDRPSPMAFPVGAVFDALVGGQARPAATRRARSSATIPSRLAASVMSAVVSPERARAICVFIFIRRSRMFREFAAALSLEIPEESGHFYGAHGGHDGFPRSHSCPRYPFRRPRADIVEVRRRPADEGPDADDRVDILPRGEDLREQGISKAPGTHVSVMSLSSTPWRLSPPRSRATTNSLKRPATIPSMPGPPTAPRAPSPPMTMGA